MDRRELEWDSKPSGLVLVEMKLPKYHTFVIIMVSKSVSPRRDDFFYLRPQKDASNTAVFLACSQMLLFL